MHHSSALLRAASAGVGVGVGVVAVVDGMQKPPMPTPRRAPRVAGPGLSSSSRATSSSRSSRTVVRITNTGSELVPSNNGKDKKDDDDDGGNENENDKNENNNRTTNLLLDDDFIDLGPQYQVPDPEKGPLEQRVGVQYLDALFSDDISEEDAAYWFTSPASGAWNTERRVLRKALPIECPPVPLGLRPADEPGAGERRDLLSMREGEELRGEIVGGSYTTGLHVDVGCRWNGLIPIAVADHAPWKRLRPGFASAEGLNVGDEVRVRVGKIIYAPLCRFPLVLELLDRPEFDGAFADPRAYGGAFDLRGAPDSDRSNSGLNGVELAAAMDALTGGAWSGGAACEVTAVPSRGYSQDNVVAEEREWLGEQVEQWQQKKKSGVAAANAAAMAAAAAAASAARARNFAASSARSASSSEEESDDDGLEEGGGEERGGNKNDGSNDGDGDVAASGDFDFDGDYGDGESGMMMFVDECGHTDLDASIARLF